MSNPGYKKTIDFFDILRENNFGEFYTEQNYYSRRGRNKDIFRMVRNFEVYYLKILSERISRQYKPIIIRSPEVQNETKASLMNINIKIY